MTVEQVVIQCAANAYMVSADSIAPDTDIRKELSDKSLNMLAFISGIENDLDISIPMQSVGSLRTIQDFIDKVSELS